MSQYQSGIENLDNKMNIDNIQIQDNSSSKNDTSTMHGQTYGQDTLLAQIQNNTEYVQRDYSNQNQDDQQIYNYQQIDSDQQIYQQTALTNQNTTQFNTQEVEQQNDIFNMTFPDQNEEQKQEQSLDEENFEEQQQKQFNQQQYQLDNQQFQQEQQKQALQLIERQEEYEQNKFILKLIEVLFPTFKDDIQETLRKKNIFTYEKLIDNINNVGLIDSQIKKIEFYDLFSKLFSNDQKSLENFEKFQSQYKITEISEFLSLKQDHLKNINQQYFIAQSFEQFEFQFIQYKINYQDKHIYNFNTRDNTIYQYDLQNNSKQEILNLQNISMSAKIIEIQNNQILYFGGINNEEEILKDIYVFDIRKIGSKKDEIFKKIGDMEEKRENVSLAYNFIDNLIYIIGGSYDKIALNSCEQYKIGEDKSTKIPNMKNERRNASSIFIWNDKKFVYTFGGFQNRDKKDIQEIERYNISEEKWEPINYKNIGQQYLGREQQLVFQSDFNNIMIFGGFLDSNSYIFNIKNQEIKKININSKIFFPQNYQKKHFNYIYTINFNGGLQKINFKNIDEQEKQIIEEEIKEEIKEGFQ